MFTNVAASLWSRRQLCFCCSSRSIVVRAVKNSGGGGIIGKRPISPQFLLLVPSANLGIGNNFSSTFNNQQLWIARRTLTSMTGGKSNENGGSKWSSFRRKLMSALDLGTTVYYMIGAVVIMVGLSFGFIPFFRMLCETTSFTGLTQIAENLDRITKMEKVEDRLIRVQFTSDVPSAMQWQFKPLQEEIYVSPGETALAFFTAKNPSNRPIVGISTYGLAPFQAAYYFCKIQCFCFDEQILNPGEEVDLPVFFYIDPEFVNDPLLEDMDSLLLSYTFFESGSNLKLPSPFDPANEPKWPQHQKSATPSTAAVGTAAAAVPTKFPALNFPQKQQ